jgi:hypothetical protein
MATLIAKYELSISILKDNGAEDALWTGLVARRSHFDKQRP